MYGELKELNKVARDLAKKQSWIRKGIRDLIEAVNEELTNIEHELWVEYSVFNIDDYTELVWLYEDGHIRLAVHDFGTDRYKTADIDELSAAACRNAAYYFPKFVER